jgi:amino acid permease
MRLPLWWNSPNTIIGAGMLAFRVRLEEQDIWPEYFCFWLQQCSQLAHGLVLLSKSAQMVGLPSSFYSVAAVAVPSYTILIDLAVALKCFGVATGK